MADVEQETLSGKLNLPCASIAARMHRGVEKALFLPFIVKAFVDGHALTHRRNGEGCVREGHRVACRGEAYRICRNEKDCLTSQFSTPS